CLHEHAKPTKVSFQPPSKMLKQLSAGVLKQIEHMFKALFIAVVRIWHFFHRMNFAKRSERFDFVLVFTLAIESADVFQIAVVHGEDVIKTQKIIRRIKLASL